MTLEFVVLVGRTRLFGSRNILHRIGRPMAVTGAAQHAAAAAFVEILGIKPFFDSFESERFVRLICHGIVVWEK